MRKNLPFSKRFMKFGCLKPSKIMFKFWFFFVGWELFDPVCKGPPLGLNGVISRQSSNNQIFCFVIVLHLPSLIPCRRIYPEKSGAEILYIPIGLIGMVGTIFLVKIDKLAWNAFFSYLFLFQKILVWIGRRSNTTSWFCSKRGKSITQRKHVYPWKINGWQFW